MKKVLFSLLAALMLVAPAFADDPVGFDDFGGVQLNANVQRWVTPFVVRNTFWGMPDFPDPPVAGYVTNFAIIEDGLVVEMRGMNNVFGDVFAPAPEPYASGIFVPWNEDMKAYGFFDPADGGLTFSAFVFDEDGNGEWITGCLTANPGLFPLWFESDECIWTEWRIQKVPEWRVHGRRLHRVLKRVE